MSLLSLKPQHGFSSILKGAIPNLVQLFVNCQDYIAARVFSVERALDDLPRQWTHGLGGSLTFPGIVLGKSFPLSSTLFYAGPNGGLHFTKGGGP